MMYRTCGQHESVGQICKRYNGGCLDLGKSLGGIQYSKDNLPFIIIERECMLAVSFSQLAFVHNNVIFLRIPYEGITKVKWATESSFIASYSGGMKSIEVTGKTRYTFPLDNFTRIGLLLIL
jgi:hypothetical protein